MVFKVPLIFFSKLKSIYLRHKNTLYKKIILLNPTQKIIIEISLIQCDRNKIHYNTSRIYTKLASQQKR